MTSVPSRIRLRRCIALGVACLLAGGLALLPTPAGSVIVRHVEGGSHPAVPDPDPGFAHVAVVAGLSGVHVGKDWILTARHVLAAARTEKKNDVVLDGRTFHLRLDTEVPLSNAGDRADLALVRIDPDPGLSEIPIAQTPPALGESVILVGNGPLQENQRRCFDKDGRQLPSAKRGAYCGYLWFKTPEGKTNDVQWGTNQVSALDLPSPGPEGTRTRAFSMTFRDEDATPQEAQAGVGDSGGPVFAKRGEDYALIGLMLSVSAKSNGAALFGDRTLAADLSVYRDAIRRVLERN